MTQTITIDPVTRLEGHGKITIQLNDAGRSRRRAFSCDPGARLREVLRGPAVLRDASPDGAHLRHLPGIAPARLGQGLRSDHVGAHSAHRRAAAAHAEPGADGAVACAELLLSVLARPAAGHGFRSGAAAHLRRCGGKSRNSAAPASACAASASTSSNCSATSASITGWVVPGGVTEPLSAAKRDEILAMMPEAYANIEPGARCLQADRRQLPAGDLSLRQLPVELPRTDQ